MFSISGKMSAMGNIFTMVTQELGAEDKVTVIDSGNLSTGIGHLVLEAAVMASRGYDRKAIAERIDGMKPCVRSSFVVDTLDYLHRGGRCSGVAAMAGGVLKIHPKILVENGEMKAGRKYRGRINTVIMDYVRDMQSDLLKAKKDRVFITHSGCDDDIIESVYRFIDEMNRFEEILITRAGGVISSHCGPGTLGVLYVME